MTWPNDLSKAAIRARNARNTLVSTCQTSHAVVRVCTIGADDGCCGGCRTVVSRRAFNRIGCFALAVITCWTGIATGLTCIVLVVTLKINHFKPNKVKLGRFQRMRNETRLLCREMMGLCHLLYFIYSFNGKWSFQTLHRTHGIGYTLPPW